MVKFFSWILILASFGQNVATDLKIINLHFFSNFSYVFVLRIVLCYYEGIRIDESLVFRSKLRDQIPNTLDSNEWKSEFKSSETPFSQGNGTGGGGRRREKKSLDTRRDKYMYTSRQVTIIYGNKIKPQGRPREKLGIEETARQGVQNDRLSRLGSFRVSPPRSVFENEARYVILFITAKCKPVTAERGRKEISTRTDRSVWPAFVSRENVRAIGKLHERRRASRSV